jgi:acyl carrier protein
MMIEDGIKKIMSDIFEVEISEINSNSSMQTISAWDSLKHMELITAIEENYDIRFKADDIVKMTNFEAIMKILQINLDLQGKHIGT